MSFNDHVLDAYDDEGRLFVQTFPGEEVPRIVKTAASVQDLKDSLPPENFALVLIEHGDDGAPRMLNKFALVDPGNTLLSAHYFYHTRGQLPEQAQKVASANICAALDQFGLPVPEELEKIAGGTEPGDPFVDTRNTARVPQIEKRASSRTIRHLQRDLTSFPEDVREMLPLQRHQRAIELSKEALALGMDASEVEPYAGSTYGNQVEMLVRARYPLLPEDEAEDAKEVYETLLSKKAEVDPETFCSALAEIDMATGLDYMWDGRVIDPARTTFEKRAWIEDDKSYMVRPEGPISSGDLENLANNGREIVEKQFGADFADKFQKNPQRIFKSMPDPVKRLMARLATSSRHTT